MSRTSLIHQFQEAVWNELEFDDKELEDVLTTLAYDMDFYEPNSDLRKESVNYFGDERLSDEVNRVIKYINGTGCENLLKI